MGNTPNLKKFEFFARVYDAHFLSALRLSLVRPFLDAADAEVAVPAIDLNLTALYTLARASERDDLASVPANSYLLNQYHGLASLLFLCIYLSIWV
jgi:hypothetical protein